MLKELRDTEKFEELAAKAMAEIANRGFDDLKADVEGFEAPPQITQKGEGENIQPEFTAKKDDIKHYFEIVNRKGDASRIISKWIVLSRLAGMRGAKLYLFVPRGNKMFAEKTIKEHEIKATILPLN